MAQRTPKHPSGMPTRAQILEFIEQSDGPAGKREIGRAFGIKGQERVHLKALLKDMADEGLIDGAQGRAFHKMGGVPKVTVLRVVDVDEQGQVFAVPDRWEAEGAPPRLRVVERGKRNPLGPGDRILARTEEAGKGWLAHPMKKLERGGETMMGVLHDEGGTLWLKGLEKGARRDLMVSDAGEAGAGDLVMAEKAGRPPRITARVTQILGDPFAPRSFSLIAIHKHGLPDAFPEETIAEAGRMAKLKLGEREDLTHLPIVAIDPADARDHDDAVWAAPDDDPKNEGGFRAIVAIADVSFYVRPGSELDRQARKRGNSVYFPDRVVPMLPEELSADMCSLKAGEDRAALACHLVIGADGALRNWRFSRARVRLAANIAYEDAQAAMDGVEFLPELGSGRGTALDEVWRGGGAGRAEGSSGLAKRTGADAPAPPPSFGRPPSPSELGEDLVEPASSPCSMPPLEPSPPFDPALVESALRPLWACWALLAKARDARSPLELDLPERRIVLDEKGRILSVAPRERLDAHRLIEDFMIAANVAAAKALEAKKAPVMYRVHEPPSREKLVALKEYLKTYGIDFALGQVIRPGTFNRIIERIGEHDARPQIMEQILRTQTQAYYAPVNAGHFGLALGSYGHFTSPIRRYADLIVHRALVGAYTLDPEAKSTGLAESDAAQMEATGELISQLERRAMEAERDTVDRYVAAYLSEQVGQLLRVRVTGVQPFGLFATVESIGGDGLLLARDIGAEYFRYDEGAQALVGDDSGTRYTLGDRLELRLVEANPISGGLRFELPEGKGGGGGSGRRRDKRGQGKGGKGGH